jgi:hypothetical protein
MQRQINGKNITKNKRTDYINLRKQSLRYDEIPIHPQPDKELKFALIYRG